MKKTPVEMLEEVLEKQHELFEAAVKEGDAMAILDIGAEIGKRAEQLMKARSDEANIRWVKEDLELRKAKKRFLK